MPPTLRYVLARESVLNALPRLGTDVAWDDLMRDVAARSHRAIFKDGARWHAPRVTRDLAREGRVVISRAGRVSRAPPSVRGEKAATRALADWFPALGGVTRVDGNLYRSPLPFTLAHAQEISRSGVRTVFSMERAAQRDVIERAGLAWRPHDWVDNGRPSFAEMDRFVADYLEIPDDENVLVHCKAGWGRTGMAAACALAVKNGWSAERALARYWRAVPHARDVMTRYGQADFVRAYVARLAKTR